MSVSFGSQAASADGGGVMWKARLLAVALGSCLCAPLVYGQVNFQSAVKYRVGSNPVAAATADFNGDGKFDLAVLNSGSNDVSILLANGDGTFQAARNFNLGNSTSSVAVSIYTGDFNADGKPDIAVFLPASTFFASGEVRILMGNGDGTLQPAVATTFNLSPGTAVAPFKFPGIAVADVNGDKKADLLVNLFLLDSSGQPNTSLNVLLGNGDGTFESPKVVSSGVKWGIVVTDLNHDKQLDLALPVSGGAQTLLGYGAGNFQPGSFIALPDGFDGISVWAADLNGDNNTDLIVESGAGSCNADGCSDEIHISAFLAQGVNFGPEHIFAVGSDSKSFDFGDSSKSDSIYNIAPGDFNGDGILDLLDRRISTECGLGQCAVTSAVLEVRSGNGDGTFSPNNATHGPTQVLADPGPLLISQDLNGDQLPDLVVPDSAVPNEIDILLNAVSGFSLRPTPATQTVQPGGSATFMVNVGQQNGFSDPVQMTCSAPTGIQCALSSSSVVPGNSLTMTVTSSAMSTSTLHRDASGVLYALFLPLLGLVSLLGLDRKGIKTRISTTLLFSGMTAGLLLLVACGGGSHPTSGGGSLTATYSVTVTGRSGSLQRSTSVSLLVR